MVLTGGVGAGVATVVSSGAAVTVVDPTAGPGPVLARSAVVDAAVAGAAEGAVEVEAAAGFDVVLAADVGARSEKSTAARTSAAFCAALDGLSLPGPDFNCARNSSGDSL